MNAQKIEKAALKEKPKKEKKSKKDNRPLHEQYDRLPLKERLKAKFLNFYFLSRVVLWIFRMVLMIGISYIVIYPFITKIAGSVMAPQDFLDVTVRLIPKNFSLDIYRAVLTEMNFFGALGNTFLLSFSTAVLQMITCCLIGYGFAKFKFRGRNFIFLLVMLTMIIPHQTLQHSMYLQFRNFDILGIVRLLNGGGIEIFGWNVMELGDGVKSFFQGINILPEEIPLWYEIEEEQVVLQIKQTGINIANTYAPLIILSITGLAFKNGLYVFLLRQFFRGIPDELEESAYMDGCGVFRTFVQIILPLSIPMMVTVFLFAFCWQWTDDFYITLINTGSAKTSDLLVKLVNKIPESLAMIKSNDPSGLYGTSIRNTIALLIISPLVVLYAFCQNFLVQGIEHSGIAN